MFESISNPSCIKRLVNGNIGKLSCVKRFINAFTTCHTKQNQSINKNYSQYTKHFCCK